MYQSINSQIAESKKRHQNDVEARNMVTGKIYRGTAPGEFQIDDKGNYWQKAPDGKIYSVKPHPSTIFVYIRDCE